MHKIIPFLLLLVILACKTDKTVDIPKQNKTATNLMASNGYIGDKQCAACHPKAYDDWIGSHHDLAMQVANDSTVLGDFNNIEITLDAVTYYFTQKGDDYVVKTKEINGDENTYIIGYTFGVEPLQQYLVDFEDGKKQVLRVSWDTNKKRWYHQYPGDTISPHDWLHWTGVSQNWNTMCAECHSTNLEKNYNVEGDSYNTTYSSINVSCESCHGPAQKHVNWAKSANGNASKDTYLISLDTQLNQMNSCAPCHARRTKLTETLEPNISFENQYILQNLSTEFYHVDGQIMEEDYVFGSFLQSEMYHQDVTCTDCHNAHTLEIKMKGNNLCLQCHEPKYNTPSHHFHESDTEGSQCINCHMTGKTYMGNDFRRDHSFRVPRPDQSITFNTPNACNNCHSDKSPAWASQKIKSWYGNERADHFSKYLLVSSKASLSSEEISQVNAFINNLDYPAIARATAIDNLDIVTEDQYQTLLSRLEDPSPLVRFNTLQKFDLAPPELRVEVASKRLSDTTKMVRVAAAQLLTGLDLNMLTTLNQSDLTKAQGELETMLRVNADFSTGRLQLGDYYNKKKQYNEAIYHYQIALKKDSLLLPVYSNLATTYSQIGNPQKALETLNILIDKAPEMSRAYYLRGLIYFELNKPDNAIADLQYAVELNPDDTRSLYNISTYYYQNKNYKLAEQFIKKAIAIQPGNGDYQYLLALVYKEQGKTDLSNQILQGLQ
ncbi:tetratricopeptide repeat protein [Hanstruepera ponticola]|uniref:tetratricopeptide repeat protein n=1 Tax=Hanstruepera ponticola TaxID=2042995 RepID=UPI0017836EE4|nr:tetratricopeptide repeat protein [Hanstruepera ponticola]